VFSLKHADAFDAALLIKDIFPSEKESSQQPVPLHLFSAPAPSPASRGVKVTASSDDRTKHADRHPQRAVRISSNRSEDLVSQLDVNPASEDTLFIYRLKNGQASKPRNGC